MNLNQNEFAVSELPPGTMTTVEVGEATVAVYNVDGKFYATQNECTHAEGPLAEGELDGNIVTCPWHASCFDVTTGAVIRRPAREPLKLFTVTIDGDIGRVAVPN